MFYGVVILPYLCRSIQTISNTFMRKIIKLTFIPVAALLLAACGSHYGVTSVERSRILVDNRYDAAPDAAATAFVAPYKAKVDSQMCPVVGRTARPLEKYQPESPLSNLMADILMWGGERIGEKPDFAVYNMGGIRAAYPAGEITYGDVLDVSPFENAICFCSLTGEKVIELFSQMAAYGGQAVSHGVEVVADTAGNIKSLKINGSEVVPDRKYRIVTLDYVAEGNDRMEAFKSKTDASCPDNIGSVRNTVVEYFKAKTASDGAVDANVEGRFVITGK